MIWILGVFIALLLLISVIRGAPYVPTHTRQVEIALDLLKLKPGEHLVDVGSGDGKVLLAAAKRGLKVTGYEINPVLFLISWWRLRGHRANSKVIWGDMWSKELPDDTKGVFVFTMGKYMPKLVAMIKDQKLKDVRMVSHGFELKDRTPIASKEAIFLYQLD